MGSGILYFNLKKMDFRKAILQDLAAMKALYADTIRSVCRKDYNEEQVRVWSSSVNKEERWLDVVTNQFVLLAEIDGVLVGFGTLRNYDYIDFFYVHKDFQGQGIARALLSRLLQEATRQGEDLVTSDISITARPFFEKNGFKVVTEQENIRQGLILINYKMVRYLPGPGPDPELKAVFNITHSFKVEGPALMLTGHLIDGEVSSHQHIEFVAENQFRLRRITGVQVLKGSNPDHPGRGLLIRCESEEELEELCNWQPFNEVAIVYQADLIPRNE